MSETDVVWQSSKPRCWETFGLAPQANGRWTINYTVDGNCEENGFTVEQIAEVGRALVAWSEGQR